MYYFKNDDTLTVVFANGTTAQWHKSHPMYEKVWNNCLKNNYLEIETLNSIHNLIMDNKTEIDNEGNVSITRDNEQINVKLSPEDKFTRFILLLKKKGVIESDIERVKPFIKNMCNNQYIDCLEELYDFCKKMDFEITEDGCFLAYKKVRSDLGSVHDGGATKHVIGQYTEVTDFDTNRNNPCSKGLHFCSHNYLYNYPGDVILIVKVNPKDVVSIPKDYNYEKGRCKKYMPIGVVDSKTMFKDIKGTEIIKEKIVRDVLDMIYDRIDDDYE